MPDYIKHRTKSNILRIVEEIIYMHKNSRYTVSFITEDKKFTCIEGELNGIIIEITVTENYRNVVE